MSGAASPLFLTDVMPRWEDEQLRRAQIQLAEEMPGSHHPGRHRVVAVVPEGPDGNEDSDVRH